LREDNAGQLLGHVVGDDVGLDQLPRLLLLVGFLQLNDRSDRLELDQIPIAHRHVLSIRLHVTAVAW
jgi:hypothetical protein